MNDRSKSKTKDPKTKDRKANRVAKHKVVSEKTWVGQRKELLKNESGEIFHTYSSYARGGDVLIGTYNYLDLTPLGRQEGKGEGMNWMRLHDRYDDGAIAR